MRKWIKNLNIVFVFGGSTAYGKYFCENSCFFTKNFLKRLAMYNKLCYNKRVEITFYPFILYIKPKELPSAKVVFLLKGEFLKNLVILSQLIEYNIVLLMLVL